MARLDARRPDNVEGDVYVDESCLDCDACRWIAPETFDRAGEQSRVHAQPADEAALRRALMALVACPTASIGTRERHALGPVLDAFPDPIDGPVFHCGFHHESSFGAASYLIVRPAGNVLVDSPRFAGPLVRRLEALGGLRWMVLTHRDDVGDHARFAGHFGCERVLHAADVVQGTRDVERRIEGGEPVALDEDLLVIPTPGHTRGSMCLLFDEHFLFTGDHIAWSPALGQIYAFRGVCWYDWGELVRSVERLAAYRFEWILPGHGFRCRFDAEAMPGELARCLAWMTAA